MNEKHRPSLFHWGEDDDIFSYVHRVYSDLYVMWPRIKLFGLRYVYDSKYRRTMKNRLEQKKRRIQAGSGFLANKKAYKARLILRDGNHCDECKRRDRPLTIDHIKPLFLGGTSILSNLRLLCDPCHREKTHKEMVKVIQPKQARVSWVRGEKCAIRE